MDDAASQLQRLHCLMSATIAWFRRPNRGVLPGTGIAEWWCSPGPLITLQRVVLSWGLAHNSIDRLPCLRGHTRVSRIDDLLH